MAINVRAEISLGAYPNQGEVAEMLGVHTTTLGRREDVVFERMGERDHRIPAAEVIRLGAVYRKRSINEVAAALVEYARLNASEAVPAVEEEVDAALDALERPGADSADRFLRELRAALPKKWYREAERVYRGTHSLRPLSAVSASPRRPRG